MAVIEFRQGNDTEAENLFATAIGESRLAGNRSEEARYTSNLGFALFRRGHHEEAVKCYQKAISLYRGLEDRSGEAQQLIYLAEVSLQELSLGEAEARLAAAKEILTAASDQPLLADILAREGDVAAVRALPDVARERYRDAQAQHERIHDMSEVAQGDLRLAGLELDQCENILAQSYARKALERFHLEHVEDQEAQAGAVLAMALVAAGSFREAERAIEKAERLANDSRDPDAKIAVALAGGRLHAAAGKPEEALHQLYGAIEQAQGAGLRRRVLEVRLAQGEVEAMRGDRQHAAAALTSLEKEARTHGFSAIANRAAWVRAGGSAGVCHPR
jgi:tetratricopeptide (TPR) repeat protein